MAENETEERKPAETTDKAPDPPAAENQGDGASTGDDATDDK